MPRALALLRGLLDTALLAALLYWMVILGVLGLWNVGSAPGWCVAYFVGLALHVVLLRQKTRTRASLEAWALAGLLSLPLVLWMGREAVPFEIRRVGGWNTLLDAGEVNWILWPYVQILMWWPAWQVIRAIPWPRTAARRQESDA